MPILIFGLFILFAFGLVIGRAIGYEQGIKDTIRKRSNEIIETKNG